jgi:hypothetical protein
VLDITAPKTPSFGIFTKTKVKIIFSATAKTAFMIATCVLPLAIKQECMVCSNDINITETDIVLIKFTVNER